MTLDEKDAETNANSADVSGLLREWITKYGPLPADVILWVARQIAESTPATGGEIFAKRLLLAYKVGGIIAANTDGAAPPGIRHCFNYRDAKRIVENHPPILPRVFLCTLDNNDFTPDDCGIVRELLDLFKRHVKAKPLTRGSLWNNTRHEASLALGGPLRRPPERDVPEAADIHIRRFS